MSVPIRLIGVTHRFGDLTVVDGMDLEVPPGSFTVIVGPSGCGKSTVLRIAAGLIQPTAGTAFIGRHAAAAGRAGFMTQGDTLLPWRRALANATLGGILARRHPEAVESEARAMFERFGLAGFEDAWPHELSGGMRQRVSLLRTLLARQPAILLDEPFGSLDAVTRLDLQQWLRRTFAEAGVTTLMVSHDLDEALLLADRVVVCSPRPGRIVTQVEVAKPTPRTMKRLATPDFAILKHRLMDALSTS